MWFQNRRAKIKNQEKAREAAEKEAAKQNGTTASTASGEDQKSIGTNNGQSNNSSMTNLDQSGGSQTDLTTPSASGLSSTPSQQYQTTTTTTTTTSSQPGSANSTPSRPSSRSGQKAPNPVLLTHADKLNMGRRVSLAGGDVASIEHWAIKRRQQMGHTPLQSASAGNSPMGLAAAARRNSQPYPTQIITQPSGDETANAAHAAAMSRSALPSPKISPNGRMPSALLFTAMRNNTLRRASMPGGAQLISTSAFTPPRITSYNHPTNGVVGHQRELSPIKDHDGDIDPALRTMSFGQSDYLSVPDASMGYSLNPGMPFSPNSPLPNPTFSFGGTPSGTTPIDPQLEQSGGSTPTTSSDPQHALFLALQRGRLGSIASINSTGTTATDGTTTADGSDIGDWASFIPPGFDPDVRRASAPADLLHNIGMLGISGSNLQMSAANNNPNLVRPSPLAGGYSQSQPNVSDNGLYSHDTKSSGHAPGQSQGQAAGGPYLPAIDSSPVSSSAIGSEGPSPSSVHQHVRDKQNLMPPPPIPRPNTTAAVYFSESKYDFDLPNHNHNHSHSTPSLPDHSPAYTFPASGEFDLPSASEFDLGFDLVSDDKDQYAFLAELSREDPAV